MTQSNGFPLGNYVGKDKMAAQNTKKMKRRSRMNRKETAQFWFWVGTLFGMFLMLFIKWLISLN